jgi:hypothetical protein
MEHNLKLQPAESPDTTLPYRNLTGSLLWIARNTRPDIMFAVIYLCRFANCYQAQHYVAAKRVVRYLVSTIDKSLTFRRDDSTKCDKPRQIEIKTYSDSDWASDSLDRRSFSGCVIYLNNCLVSWCSKKQATVALSSVEAEYMALSDASRETLYVSNLISEFFQIAKPIPVYVDNKGAGFIAENNINNKMTKHIDIRYHFVRYYIKDGTIELFYVPTAANIADALTKALVAEIHKRLLAKLLGIA